MSNSTSPHCDLPGNGANTIMSPMELRFSSAVDLNSNDTVNTQQRQSYPGHTPYPDIQQQQQQQQQPITRIRLPSFSSLISGTPDPLIPDYAQSYYNMQTQVDCMPPAQFSSSNIPTATYYQRWSTPTVRSSQQVFTAPTKPINQPHREFASPHTEIHSTPPSKSIYLQYNQQQRQPSNNSSHYISIDTNESAAVAGSSPVTNKPRRTRKPKFLTQVGSCVLSKRWPARKDRNNQSNIVRRGSSTSLTSRSHHPDHQCHHHHHPRTTQQQDCTCHLSSTTDSSPTPLPSVLLPTSSAVSIPSLTISSTSSSSPTIAKPRWQEAERLDLLKAIVREKHLDDMTSFSWDRISLVVGRAKKACKDQWRREVLPALMEKLK